MNNPTIYIGNLSYNRDENGIKFIFSEFGPCREVIIVRDPKTKKSKGYAFVTMKNPKDAELALASLNGKVVDGRTIKVSAAQEREDTDSKISYKPHQETEAPIEIEEPRKKQKRVKKKKGLEALMDYLGK